VNAPRSVAVFNTSPSPHRLQTVGALVSGQPQKDAASMVKMSPEELRLGQSSAEKKEETKSKNSIFELGKQEASDVHSLLSYSFNPKTFTYHSSIRRKQVRFDPDQLVDYHPNKECIHDLYQDTRTM
jgi:hypothetical protein